MKAVFVCFTVSCLLCFTRLGCLVVSAGQAGATGVFLKHAHKWGFFKDTVTFNELSIKSDYLSHSYSI